MTKKRFTLTHINEQYLSANLYDNGTFIASIGIGAELIVELLNSLNDENVKLRARNKYLATKIQRERNIHVKEHKKWEEEIQKENDELKQQLSDCKEKKQQMKEFFMNSEPVIEQKKLQKLIYQTIINLIDEKIQYYEHKPFSSSISNPMSVNFDEDVDRLARLSELEQLKKELEL